MRFCSLGSGSSGNGTLIEARDGTRTSRVLIDCGFSLRDLTARLARVGLAPTQLDAVFITHEHGDHIGCAASLARRHGVPLWTSRGTALATGLAALDPVTGEWTAADGLALHIARDGLPIAIGALQLEPYTVPHDAREPLQLCLGDGQRRLGVLTDAGMSTPYLLATLQRCDGLLLECNHDRAMLAASSYPPSVRARIAGRLGHLANDSAADVLAACRHDRLRHVVAAHLSERNNTPALARAALAVALGCADDDVLVADPLAGLDWLDLQG